VDAPKERLDLPPEVANTAFRCVQEALTNVTRHSSARAVRVRLAREGTSLQVEVHDDGVGARGARPGVGLIGMRERAEAVGGGFRFETRGEGGCSVYMTLPVAV
jgi:signal transduction histidine kinase